MHFDLTNHFLIAMPSLADPNFARTVTYMCVHNDDGAMGIVINRPLELELGEVLAQMDLAAEDHAVRARPVFQGGPVQTDRGFILHRPAQSFDSTMQVTAEVGLSTSRDILAAMSDGDGPEESLVALGFAGWSPGQLEQEMADNAWLSGPADPSIMFTAPPSERWSRAARLLGIDPDTLSHDIGHA